ncbi:GNAS complex locus [Phyllostomus discolor]|uniref:GNAS complex locus n=1 Tax=Phyllostomus discolor TaxID=89673 RepID=A0A6J2MS93_9CHIR|nr:neuroendocrine secretory protein 55-like [Phyllostomus discolor]KAF6088051.1 GNAS complex locus [Phyllostomus discolor]
MDRRFRAQQWRRARHHYNDLCPSIGRRAATALLWLSCSIALLRALATSNTRAHQRAATQQRRTFLNAHHRSATQVLPEPPESLPEPEGAARALPLPGCPDYEEDFDYESESDFDSDFDFDTETETAPTTEPETEPEDERGPAVPKQSTFGQSLTERLHALRLRSPDASPSSAQPSTREPQPGDKARRGPGEPAEPKKEKQQQRRCKPKKPTRRDPSPESPSKRGPIPIRRH